MKIRMILLTCLLFSCGRNQSKDPSFVGWWTFDEGKVVKDVSGHALDGALIGGEWTEGKNGKAIHFDGLARVIVEHRPVLDSLTTDLTVCAWVKRDTSKAWNTFVSREVREGWSEYIGLAVFADTALFSVDPDGSHYSNIKDTTACPAGVWIHLAGMVKDSTYILYVNGAPVRSGRFNPPVRYADTNPLVIGGNTNSQGREWVDPFHGIIDDVRLYKRALGDAEIRAMVSVK